jgi:hypothetical protein
VVSELVRGGLEARPKGTPRYLLSHPVLEVDEPSELLVEGTVRSSTIMLPRTDPRQWYRRASVRLHIWYII